MSVTLRELIENDDFIKQNTVKDEEVSDDMAVHCRLAAISAEVDKLVLAKAIGYAKASAKCLAAERAIAGVINDAEGENVQAKDAALVLLSFGIDPQVIVQALNLSLEEVLELDK